MSLRIIVKGHTFTTGPTPTVSINGGSFVGPAYCTCGAKSLVLDNQKQRREWHSRHKASVKVQPTKLVPTRHIHEVDYVQLEPVR